MSNKILFFGNERLATSVTTTAPTLQALLAAGYEITGVVVAQNESAQSRNARELEIVQIAAAHNIPVLSPAKLSDAKDEIAAHGADIGVLVAYGKLVPQDIIDLFPHGIINIHPSLLPRHRGPTPIESAILSGEPETGVSVMQLTSGMDAGPVYGQARLPLSGTETKQALADVLLTLGKGMVLELLPQILDGSLQPIAQDESQVTYDNLITKDVSTLDWQKPAVQLDREIRAYLGWPRSRTTLGTSEVIITAAHAEIGSGRPGDMWIEDQRLGIYTSDGLLILEQLIPAGKSEMSGSAFLLGYQL